MILSDFSTTTATKIALQFFGVSVNKCKSLAGDSDKNYYIKSDTGVAYILKIASPIAELDNLQMQNEMMAHLAQQDLELGLPQVVENKKGETITVLSDDKHQAYYVRLLTWVTGRMWADVNPVSNDLLSSLGTIAGQLTKALQGFAYQGAYRKDFRWDNCRLDWVKTHRAYVVGEERQALVDYFIDLFENKTKAILPTLRKSVVQGDLNDNNIVVSTDKRNPTVVGVIDFGDSIYLPTINELAIALAYAMMDKADPIAAARPVIHAFHSVFPLTEKEIGVLFSLITNRLLISVVNSSYNAVAEPDNEYLLISAKPAWHLLEQLRKINPDLAHYHFRMACAWEAVPQHADICKYLKANQDDFASIIDYDLKKNPFAILDLGVGSLDLGNNSAYENPLVFDKKINQLLEAANVPIGIGQYDEIRPIYTTDNFLETGNEGSQWRTVHLGIDLFGKAMTPIYAPLDGIVHSFQNNAIELDYGPTIILEHRTDRGEVFYTLYGHLDLACLENLVVGMPIMKGQAIAKIGPMPINGNWPPHVHFQVVLDMLGTSGNFDGVAFPSERQLWTSLCPNPNLILGLNLGKEKASLDADAILGTRKKHLGRSLSLSYTQPLHMLRGYKQYLFDVTGRRYLDTVNNVPHVGHQHPRVVRAAQRQMAVLNTNTRYLHENIVRYAEELCATLPEELSVCHFVNSGSEANELAIRMARAYSGHKNLLVSAVGYHGNTNACIDVSSYKFEGKGGKGAPDWVHVMPIADGYRGQFKTSDPQAGSKYAQYLKNKIEELKAKGEGISGFLCEPILSCGGQVVPPDNYFKEAYAHVRAAGGVCIADEVQVGFARPGKTFWGFELHGVVPDIVVMGKPIGNGHPLGAVVTTAAVADAFANGMEYFNTFGGNPVSCAIGREVLQIIHDEHLQQNAFEVGEYLKKGLRELMNDFPIIGDVRGEGLFLGFELVRNRETLEPADRETAYLANRMRQLGVLNSTDGLHHNVIKLKPPICFTKSNAAFLLDQFKQVFKEDFMQGS